MNIKNILILIVVSACLFAKEEKRDLLKRIETHFLLEDSFSAMKEAERGLKIYPNDISLNKAYLKSLAGTGYDERAIKLLNALPKKLSKLKTDSQLLEDISWSILKKGLNSTQYSTRLSSMVGVYFTRDARAVNILREMMRDSNAILRSVAVQLSVAYRDVPLIDKVSSLLDNEKVWLVRLEVLKAIGQMKIIEKSDALKEILKDERATFQERALAIKSLIDIYDGIDLEELTILLNSSYAGFRCLGCELASSFKVEQVKDVISRLVSDARYDVRISALNAIALYYKEFIEPKELIDVLDKAYEDTNAFVAITAAWLGLVIDPERGEAYLKKWAFDKYSENRRFAAAAIAQSGGYGIELSKYILKYSEDPFVKANISMGLIGQKQDVSKCCDVLYDFIKQKDKMWMWDSSYNSLFKILAPSEIRHTDQMPNYPEAIDQIVQLNVLSVLAILEDSRAQDAIKTFLKRKAWGVTGLAAITLLQEGDEESIEVLRSLLKDKEKYVRIQAALAIAAIGKDKSALPILEEAYFSADHELKLNILSAIGNISKQESFPFLLKVLEEPFQILRIAAASSIIQAANL